MHTPTTPNARAIALVAIPADDPLRPGWAWHVGSADAEGDSWNTTETTPPLAMSGEPTPARSAREAALLHLARTHPLSDIVRLWRDHGQDGIDAEADAGPGSRAYAAELVRR